MTTQTGDILLDNRGAEQDPMDRQFSAYGGVSLFSFEQVALKRWKRVSEKKLADLHADCCGWDASL